MAIDYRLTDGIFYVRGKMGSLQVPNFTVLNELEGKRCVGMGKELFFFDLGRMKQQEILIYLNQCLR
jgi:hypothetical protein